MFISVSLPSLLQEFTSNLFWNKREPQSKCDSLPDAESDLEINSSVAGTPTLIVSKLRWVMTKAEKTQNSAEWWNGKQSIGILFELSTG